MRHFTAAVAVLLSLACAFSCKKEKGGGDTLEKIYFVDPASASMVLSQGQTGYIMYATVPESAAATAVMEWSSSDTNIAEVFNGQVTAIAPGNTVITVKYCQMRQRLGYPGRAGGADSGHQFQRS